MEQPQIGELFMDKKKAKSTNEFGHINNLHVDGTKSTIDMGSVAFKENDTDTEHPNLDDMCKNKENSQKTPQNEQYNDANEPALNAEKLQLWKELMEYEKNYHVKLSEEYDMDLTSKK